jgi:hypothetical protein
MLWKQVRYRVEIVKSFGVFCCKRCADKSPQSDLNAIFALLIGKE